MRRLTLIAIMILGLGLSLWAQTPQVIRHANPEAALQSRWDWAIKAAAKAEGGQGAWVVYTIEKRMGINSFTGTLNGDNWQDKVSLHEWLYGEKVNYAEDQDKAGLSQAEIIRREARKALSDMNRDEEDEKPQVLKELAFLFSVDRKGDLGALRISNTELHVKLDGRPLIWCGKADPVQSRDLLLNLFNKAQDLDTQKHLLHAQGAHPSDAKTTAFFTAIVKGNGDDELREDAAFWLGQSDDPDALKTLIEVAKADRNEDVREKAVFAISQLELPEALDALIDLAYDAPHGGVREKAVFWMGQSKSPKALKTLKGIAQKDPDEDVREKAVFAISQIKLDEASDILTDLAYHAPHVNVREKAVFWLGQRKDPSALKTLLDMANNDASTDIREQAVFGITQMRSTEALEALIDLAYHAKNQAVREKAIFWLGQKASSKAAEALEKVASDSPGDLDIQEQAVFAISQLPKDEGVPKLIKIAQTHPSVRIRKKAIFWLGQSGDQRALDALVSLIQK